MPTSRPQTPAEVQVKEPQQGIPRYGCPHLQKFLSPGPMTRLKETVASYKGILRVIFDATPLTRQTSLIPKSANEKALTTLTPNYLCLQCVATTTEQNRLAHGTETKHRFYVESRTASVYCQICDDFVWDPTLEELKVQKLSSGAYPSKKRKHEDLLPDPVTQDPKFLSINTMAAPCRASGIRGIYNMGATCYMNVILQSFVHNPLLRNFYLGDNHPKDECSYKNCMSCAMDDMFQQFYADDATTGYSASNILASFWLSKRKAYEELASNKEQDAHEFFQFLTEELHEINGGGRPSGGDDTPSLKKLKIGSDGCDCIVHQTFYGKLQSTITCQNAKCGGVTTSVESFLDLSLGLEAFSKKKSLKASPLSLRKCLDEEYKNWEHCDYNCHKCDSHDAKKQLSIKRLPNVLCIQLKRFKQNNGQASKIETEVSFPLKLDMLPYTDQARSQDTRESFALARLCTYELQSVVQHIGQLDTGHYASFSRVGDQWFRFNDHIVTLASKSEVLKTQAFLLFYVIKHLA